MELLKRIEDEGERQTQEVLAQANAQAQELIAQAERAIAEQRVRILREFSVQLEQERRATLSRARAQARAEFLRAKSHVAEALFGKISTDMAHLRADAAGYRKFLQGCLQEAERAIPSPLVIHVAAEDQRLMQDLLRQTPHKLGEPLKTTGGLLATNERGDLVIDNCLETRLANLRARYRAELSKVLFDRARPD